MNHSEQPFSKNRYYFEEFELRNLRSEEAFLIAENLVTMEPWVTLQYSKESLTCHLQDNDSSLKRFTVVIENQVAGIVCIRYPWLLGPYLEILCLFKPFQGAGYGNKILHWLKNEAFLTSKNLWTLVSSFNKPAWSFYKAFGFEQIALLPDLVCLGYDEVLLRILKRNDDKSDI